MFGFGKKPENQRAQTDPEKSEKPGLRVREGGGNLAPEKPPEEVPKERVRLTKANTKLHLMTNHEENDRAFQAAREQYLSKNLPTVNKVAVRKERSKLFDEVMDRVIAIVGFFLILLGWLWLYHHGQQIEDWWKAFLDSYKVL